MDTINQFRLTETVTFTRWLSGLKDHRAKAQQLVKEHTDEQNH